MVAATLLFTDGACSGNPGPGGWGVLIKQADAELGRLCGGSAATTNNRMELQAVIEGLTALPPNSLVTVHTDSKYVLDGFTKWLPGWIKKGWRTQSGPVKNKDLWERLIVAAARHSVDWVWVKGHNGHYENEIADELARMGIAHPDGLQANLALPLVP